MVKLNAVFLTTSLVTASTFMCALKQVQAEDWLQTAPRGDTLPGDRPPASFEDREHFLYPFGVSGDLFEPGKPALLHSNKFYANWLVCGTG